MIKKLNMKEDNNIEKSRTFRRVEALCKRFGYILAEDSCLEVIGTTKYLDIYIYADGTNKYAPTIYSPNRAADRKILDGPTFKIQTSSYGALDVSEYEEYVQACENAYKLVSALKDINFSDFPEYTSE